ncbi:MAG: hypothetical protein QOI43_3169 [Gaiellales bacterium]|jgi:hypothetical protein|nr:hypothetical protein [Gaiellales bacterium]
MTKAEFHRDLTAMTHQLLGDGQTFHNPDKVRVGDQPPATSQKPVSE